MTASKRAKPARTVAFSKASVRAKKTQATTRSRVLESEAAGTGSRPISKRALLVERLSQPQGARIDDLTRELGWLPHTVRAALTGLRRNGYVIAREKAEDEVSVYRATAPAAQKVSTPPSVKKAGRISKRAA